MNLRKRLRAQTDAIAANIGYLAQCLEMKMALHETGWLGASGKGAADDIRCLAQAWADAELRAAKEAKEAMRHVPSTPPAHMRDKPQ